MKFKIWLKKNLSVTPSSELDDLIFSKVAPYLNKEEEKERPYWIISVLSFSLVVVFVIKLTSITNHSNQLQPMVTESIELIKNYDDLELMVASAKLTPEEWKSIQ